MRILVTGASGQLGAYLLDETLTRGRAEVTGWCHRPAAGPRDRPLRAVDLTDELAVEAALREAAPEVVIHLAAISAADAVRRDPERGRAVNVRATERLARWCGDRDRRLIFASTDMVFDGERGGYREDDPACPVLEYGRTKAEAEAAVLAIPRAVVARISLLFGPSRAGRESFFDRAISALRRGEPQAFFEDEYRTPMHYATAARALMGLAGEGSSGIIHVGGAERVSRFELMSRAARALGLDPRLVRRGRRADVPTPEPRPRDLSLDTALLAETLPGLERPSIEDSLRDSGE
ncbi:dTDP-4-dehydrorhamnose reductase [Aquisphaera giovannonii]|uniref:dTDP-4-dehydrorhamnose reductase n=1 Tax=Aquisphaera giovannonii TaxID=406548 RepID=A0A5B9W272_9BACT|nr:SDR family oxidoreductase [Aquisphaera giovannonii]QEH34090.1 dTDP-4-dehydrorhamnose reductase [Aquisphaera giovannonii]